MRIIKIIRDNNEVLSKEVDELGELHKSVLHVEQCFVVLVLKVSLLQPFSS